MKHTLVILLTTLGIAACGTSSTPTQYYQLPDSSFQLPTKQGQAIGVKIVLAEPLKSNSLLYQTDAYTLHFAQKNVWAAPLDEALAAAFANKLNRQSSLKYVPRTQQGNTLTIYLDRFQGSYTGETEISGYAQWQNGRQVAFHAKTPQQGDGYAAMLDSLNQGLDTAVQQLIQ